MIDLKFGREQRIDAIRIATKFGDSIAHRRQIDDRRYAGKILQHDSRREERDLALGLSGWVPTRQCLHVSSTHDLCIFVTQQVLEQDLERIRQPGYFDPRLFRERR